MIENEYADYYAQVALEKKLNPCDPYTGAYMLMDDASPSESPLYFHALKSAVDWAENTYDFAHGEWSVYRVGNKIL